MSRSNVKGKIFAGFALLLIAVLLLSTFASILMKDDGKVENASQLKLGSQTFSIARATTDQERITGLSGQESIAPGTGLLFDFYDDGDWGIWMKDMLFSIDVIWISEKKEVVHIEENLAPDTYPTVFRSPDLARYVFEINAGEVKEHSIEVGDVAEFLDL